MKVLQKSWLLQNNKYALFKKQKALMCFLLFSFFLSKAQIANYVSNGGFEECGNCPQMSAPQLQPKYWSSIDTNKFFGQLLSATITPYLVPNSSYTYQWPVHGSNYLGTEHFLIPVFPTTTITRGYPRNRLKNTLQTGHTYCVKFFCNISNQSTHGISSIGAYFGNSSLDTITQCETPITYLTPQIVNPATNTITDTLNWTLITGTFVANGTEKYMVLGNFKNDNNSGAVLINSTNLPAQFCSVLYDDVSVIDVDLPPYAGPDIFGIPNNTVYIGRPQDVGIDEACIWYKLPNTTTAIDTAAGITRTVSLSIDTYVVRQEICGNVKWDTVVVYPSGVGLTPLSFGEGPGVRLYPQPANEDLVIESESINNDEKCQLQVLNNLGQVIREEEISFKNKRTSIQTNDLPNGIYLLNLSCTDSSLRRNDKVRTVSKRFVISR